MTFIESSTKVGSGCLSLRAIRKQDGFQNFGDNARENTCGVYLRLQDTIFTLKLRANQSLDAPPIWLIWWSANQTKSIKKMNAPRKEFFSSSDQSVNTFHLGQKVELWPISMLHIGTACFVQLRKNINSKTLRGWSLFRFWPFPYNTGSSSRTRIQRLKPASAPASKNDFWFIHIEPLSIPAKIWYFNGWQIWFLANNKSDVNKRYSSSSCIGNLYIKICMFLSKTFVLLRFRYSLQKESYLLVLKGNVN